MKAIRFSNKKWSLSFLIACTLALLFIITGYSFSINILDYLLGIFIFVYPLIRLFRSKVQTWIKVTTGLVALMLLSYIGYAIIYASAFGGSGRKLKAWNINQYRVVLTKRLDWVGPEYLQYDLYRKVFFGLLSKPLAYGNPGRQLKGGCTVDFKEDMGNNLLYEFDSCKETIKKAR